MLVFHSIKNRAKAYEETMSTYLVIHRVRANQLYPNLYKKNNTSSFAPSETAQFGLPDPAKENHGDSFSESYVGPGVATKPDRAYRFAGPETNPDRARMRMLKLYWELSKEACSKAFLLLSLTTFVVLLISSEVSANDFAENTDRTAETGKVEKANYGDSFSGRYMGRTILAIRTHAKTGRKN
ncbi:hypothetical protein L484_014024 [Morus notabilis]|uniref:Uncharacterized protein n=1 Tax=Morus notabilis TaxID=981085 RepID=W9RBI9_9ROSA|nr:hypothetical protein L484_014024 [Morus notabilis]